MNGRVLLVPSSEAYRWIADSRDQFTEDRTGSTFRAVGAAELGRRAFVSAWAFAGAACMGQ